MTVSEYFYYPNWCFANTDDAQSITFPVDNMSVAMTEKDTAQEVNGVTPEISTVVGV